jgi:hypothetical protein
MMFLWIFFLKSSWFTDGLQIEIGLYYGNMFDGLKKAT